VKSVITQERPMEIRCLGERPDQAEKAESPAGYSTCPRIISRPRTAPLGSR